MPARPSHPENQSQKSRADRARRALNGVGISREDSDDELGYEDHPWEWIYEGSETETETTGDTSSNKENEEGSSPTSDHGQQQAISLLESNQALNGRRNKKKKKNNNNKRSRSSVSTTTMKPGRGAAATTAQRRIVGARMGTFQCRLSDCVLLKAEGTSEAWVGMICEFREAEADDDEEKDEGNQDPDQDQDRATTTTNRNREKLANIMWFSTEKEIKNRQKKRMDFMSNELYITPSWDMNPLTSINGKATVMSPSTFQARYPGGKVPRTSRDHGKIFVCRRGCNTRTATYTNEFVWEDVYGGAIEDVYRLIELVQSETKATRKRGRREDERKEKDQTKVLVPMEAEDDGLAPETPRKKRKLTAASTPKSGRSAAAARTPQKFTTPSHKRIIVKKPLEFTPLGTRILSPSHIESSPFQIARSRLHVASVPTALPCREQEFETVYSHLEAAISEGSGTCIYISGTPGTGKTATVREVVAQLDSSVLAEELDDFIFVEINGMKVTDPHQSYSLLWEALRGDRVSPSHALDLLEREFSHPSPRRVPCVVLMDELDQLVTRNQSVMYNFFNWPSLRHSRLIVLAVANTMDLPERTLSNKISSRLGLTRITFPGYTHEQLIKIIQSRLEGVPGNMVDPDAVQFASRKVAAVSGDARRALDICRRAVEIAEDEQTQADELLVPPTPSKSAKRRKDDTQTSRATNTTTSRGRVTINTIKQAINEATSSPLQQFLRCLPLASRVFLAAVLARTRRTGIAESVLGDVMDEAKRIAKMAASSDIQRFLLAEGIAAPPTKGTGHLDNTGTQMSGVVPRALGMGRVAFELMEAGVIGLEARKGERTGKMRLNISEDEIKLALRDDPEVRGLGFSA